MGIIFLFLMQHRKHFFAFDDASGVKTLFLERRGESWPPLSPDDGADDDYDDDDE